VLPGVQNSFGDGQRRASCNSMNFIQKYKKIEKKVMQFMWKKGIGCIVLTTQPEKYKGLFMQNNFALKVDNLQALLHR